jgi:hypothetical protein
MIALNNLRVVWKIRILIGMAALALGVFAWVSFSTRRAVEVNGPLYKQISDKEDITQDVNPPVMGLTPTRLQVYIIMAETNRAKRDAEIARLHQFRTDFEKMMEEDVREAGEGKIKDLLVGELSRSAVEYWDQVDHGLLPLVLKGDKRGSRSFGARSWCPLRKETSKR